MKYSKALALLLAAALLLPAACASPAVEGATVIQLSDQGVTIDGREEAVTVGGEIVYYHDGTDEAYGEGAAADMHTAEEAAAHTLVTVTQPGTYRLTGVLSKGQIAVDLGEGAKDDPQAVVTLILDNVDVTCTVAPALIFYNVYECDRAFVGYSGGGNGDYKATAEVDTSGAGANVVLAAGSVNTFTGSHVARIYKEGTTESLLRYDGAFYSKMSMNIDGDGGDDSGVLNIIADDEGLDTELHLTINGGTINIDSQDDGINTNEDYVSVTTVNGGTLNVSAGQGAEGDGIDSNGYLVINGGTVWTAANPQSGDGGIDADLGILLNGGTVYAFGAQNDAADSASAQPYLELSFASTLPAESQVRVTDGNGDLVIGTVLARPCQSLTLSCPELELDVTYQVYVDGVLQCWNGSGSGMGRGGMGGRMGGQTPPEAPADGQTPPEAPADGQQPPEAPDGETPPEAPDGQTPPDGQRPQGGQRPDGEDFDPAQRGGKGFGPGQRPDGEDFDPDDLPEDFDSSRFGGKGGMGGGFPGDGAQANGSGSTDFVLTETVKRFSGVTAYDPDALPFTDVSEEDEGYGAIRSLYKAGAMQGTGDRQFSPHMTLTRAQAITVLARLARAEEAETDRFTDVEQGSWYSGYVGWAVEQGIVQGDGQGHFYPDMTVTAEQMELMLRRYRADYQNSTGFQGELTRAQLAQMAVSVLD